MKLYFLLISLSLFFNTVYAQNSVVVQVSNFENDMGVCRACLFNTEASFNGEGKPVQCVQTLISNRTTRLVFTNVVSGVYAISVFHDSNNNNKFDKNFLGIPKEGYGASKNKLPFASAPTFTENKFSIDTGVTNLKIRLRNL